jgi:XTP/dITP diphosphohydrolase
MRTEHENPDFRIDRVVSITAGIDELEKMSLSERVESEYGDVLFSLINYGRFLGLNPESALEKTNQKFMKRFMLMEELAAKDGADFTKMNLEEMDIYWDAAKKIIAENQSL